VENMHIKNIHSIIEKLSECVKCEVDKGIDQVDTKEMGEVADIIKDLCEAEYYAKISKAMDEAEYGEDYDYMGAYDEHERKGYRGQRRDSRGRYMSRRSYTEPMMMHDDMREMDYMDGRMYYGGSTGGNSSNMGGSSSGMSSGSSNTGSRGYSEGGQMSSRMQRDGREGRSGESRRGYMESKETGKDKSEKMHELETYMKDLSEDVTEMIGGMSPEEKALMKNKMQTLMTKIQ
jgi:hypothetical protein